MGFILQSRYIFLEEVFELLFGEHGLNDFKNGGLVFFVQLIDQVHLFKAWLSFYGHFLWKLPFKIYDLVYCHPEKLGELLKFFYRWFADTVFQFVVVGIANAQFGSHLLSKLFAMLAERMSNER